MQHHLYWFLDKVLPTFIFYGLRNASWTGISQPSIMTSEFFSHLRVFRVDGNGDYSFKLDINLFLNLLQAQ